MNTLVEFIKTYIPGIAGVATSIVFLIFLVLNISEDFDKIVCFGKRVLNVQRYLDKLYYSKKRRKYNEELIDSEFIKWQMELLEKIYNPLIRKKQEQGWNINLTELEIGGIKQKYEAITLNMKEISFPFKGICDKQRLETKRISNKQRQKMKKDIWKPKYSEGIRKYSKFVREYYRLVKSTIRYPKRVGYMLEEIYLDKKDKEWGISAYTGTYENNIKSSHILEYEIYKLYKKMQRENKRISQINREDLLKMLPIRNSIHQNFLKDGDESDILVSGKYRESLLSVQAFVLVRNFNGSYDVLRIRRSENVSAKANYLQFIPSGGFEVANDCNDFDSQWDGYSLSKVIFRELLEECFGVDEDDKHMSSNNVSPERIYHNKHIKKLIAMLRGEVEGKKSHMELLGTTMSLVGLRQEFSFILRVDDADFSTEFVSNYESGSAIHMIDINNIEKASFWCGKDDANDLEMLNCTSAGLFELARKSKLYREALNMNHKAGK